MWTKSRPILTSFWRPLTTRSSSASTSIRASRKISVVLIGSLRWSVDCFIIGLYASSGECMLKEEEKRKELLLIQGILSIEINYLDSSEAGELWVTSGANRELTERRLSSGKIWREKSSPCGHLRSTSSCSIWLSWKIKLRVRYKQESSWRSPTSNPWTRVSESSTRKQICLRITLSFTKSLS